MGFLIPGSLVRVQPGVFNWASSGGARPEGIATPKSQPAGARCRAEFQLPNRSRHCRGEIIAMSPCMPMGRRCARSPVTIYRARAATAAAIT